MDKLLAALSLPQVGEIKSIPIEKDPEGKGGLFELELKTRVYLLRSKSDTDANIWVKVLKHIRDNGKLSENINNNEITNHISNIHYSNQIIHNNNNDLVAVDNSIQEMKIQLRPPEKEKENEDTDKSIESNGHWKKEKRTGCLHCCLFSRNLFKYRK